MSLSLNIQRMQREEEAHQRALANVKERDRVEGVVSFEHRSGRMIDDRIVRERIAAENKKLRAKVDERRAQLAALLERERAVFQRDIAASFESAETVKERLFAHARTLKDKREAARRALAAELEDKRFRLSSDALRARASAITAERTALDRLEQLQHKQRLAQLGAHEEAEEAAKTAASVRGFHDEQRVAAEAKRRLAAEAARVLGQQVAVRRDLTAAEQAYEDGMVQRLLEADRAAAAAQRQAEADRREHARAEYERVQAFNAKEQATKSGASGREAAEDKANLEAALAREAAEAEAEKQARFEARRRGVEQQRALQQAAGAQAEDQSWMDRFYQEEFDKEWAKRQEQWDREAAARKALLDEVTQGRLNQMADRARQGDAERTRDAAQMESFARGRAEAEAKERAKQEKRELGLRNQAMFNKTQLEDNGARREREKQEAFLEWRLQQKFERDYEQRVSNLIASADPGAVRHGIKSSKY